MAKYIYHVTKIWYDEGEMIESDVPLTDSEVRKQIDENRTYCDEIDIDEEIIED